MDFVVSIRVQIDWGGVGVGVLRDDKSGGENSPNVPKNYRRKFADISSSQSQERICGESAATAINRVAQPRAVFVPTSIVQHDLQIHNRVVSEISPSVDHVSIVDSKYSMDDGQTQSPRSPSRGRPYPFQTSKVKRPSRNHSST